MTLENKVEVCEIQGPIILMFHNIPNSHIWQKTTGVLLTYLANISDGVLVPAEEGEVLSRVILLHIARLYRKTLYVENKSNFWL